MTISKTLKPLSIALAVIYANGVYAETPNLLDDASLSLGSMVVSSDNIGPLTSRNLSTSVDVLSQDRIEDQNVNYTWQLFDQMPGVMLTQWDGE